MINKKSIDLLILLGSFFYSYSLLAQISVIDNAQREVTLSKPAERIVSLAPHITENLFSAGAGEKLVGVEKYSDYPEQTRDIQKISHTGISIELILQLNPDLIVAWKSVSNAGILNTLEKLGFIIYYSEPRNFDDIVDNIHNLAKLAGTEQKLNTTATTASLRQLANTRSLYKNKSKVSVFYQVWTDPLITLNGDHLISRVLDICGAVNIFSALPMTAPQVSLEAVVEANPDVIITGRREETPAEMSVWNGWDVIAAVKKQHYIFVDSDRMHRPTLRMLKAIPGVCEQINQIREQINP